MKKLVVRSETELDDRRAALLIEKQMVQGDCDQVVWFSDMGRKVAQMVEATDLITKIEGLLSSQASAHSNISCQVSDLKFGLADLKIALKLLGDRFEEFKNPPKPKEKKPNKEKTNEEVL